LAGWQAASPENDGEKRRFLLPKNSILSLILGGVAVHRYDHRLVFNTGFSR